MMLGMAFMQPLQRIFQTNTEFKKYSDAKVNQLSPP